LSARTFPQETGSNIIPLLFYFTTLAIEFIAPAFSPPFTVKASKKSNTELPRIAPDANIEPPFQMKSDINPKTEIFYDNDIYKSNIDPFIHSSVSQRQVFASSFDACQSRTSDMIQGRKDHLEWVTKTLNFLSIISSQNPEHSERLQELFRIYEESSVEFLSNLPWILGGSDSMQSRVPVTQKRNDNAPSLQRTFSCPVEIRSSQQANFEKSGFINTPKINFN